MTQDNTSPLNLSDTSSTIYLIDSLDKIKNTQANAQSTTPSYVLLIQVLSFLTLLLGFYYGLSGYDQFTLPAVFMEKFDEKSVRVSKSSVEMLVQQQTTVDLKDDDLKFRKKVQKNLTTEPNVAITTNKYDSKSSKIDNSHSQIFILTRRDSFKIRQTISETWANNYAENITFMVGNYCTNPAKYRKPWLCETNSEKLPPKDTNIFNEEAEKFSVKEELINQSIFEFNKNSTSQPQTVILPFMDTYRNLTLKVKESYKYLLDKHPTANWFIKTDDDQYCRPKKLFNFLKNIVDMTKADPDPVRDPINEYIILGKIRTHAPVMRYGKWEELKKNYIKSFYPSFPVGSAGHAVNRKVAQYIVDNAENLINYQGEDVSVGIWASKIRDEDHPENQESPVILKSPKSNLPKYNSTAFYFSNSGRCTEDKFSESLIIGHDIGPKKMTLCYEKDVTANNL